MKHVIRYLLEGNGTVPVFVRDGGYFAQGHELVGISVDDSERHLPASVHKLTKAELIARAQATQVDINGDPLTEEAATALVEHLLEVNDMADYA